MTKYKKSTKSPTESEKFISDRRSPIPLNEATSHVLGAMKAKNTKPELVLRHALGKGACEDIGYTGKRLRVVPTLPSLIKEWPFSLTAVTGIDTPIIRLISRNLTAFFGPINSRPIGKWAKERKVNSLG